MTTSSGVEPDSSVQRRDVSTDRGTFAALVCTPHETPLPHGSALLIPGLTGSKEDFAAVLPLLGRAGWRAAAFDQRGQFETPASDSDEFTLDSLADDASAVARALFGGVDVHLVGHSFGGLVAATAVLREPASWATLVLLCSGPGGVTGPHAEQLLAAARRVESDGLPAAYEASLQRDLALGRQLPSEDRKQFLRQRFLANSPRSLAAMTRLAAEAPDRTADLAASGVPVAVIRGESDDAWPHPVQDQLAKDLGTRVVVVSGAGHSVAAEQPAATKDALVRIFMASR